MGYWSDVDLVMQYGIPQSLSEKLVAKIKYSKSTEEVNKAFDELYDTIMQAQWDAKLNLMP